MIDLDLLNDAQDAVFADESLWPKGNETFCNIASLHVARAVGCDDLDAAPGAEPLLADEMYGLMKASLRFVRREMADAQALVNVGTLVFAILPSARLGQSDGHVCTLTPSVTADYSEHWDLSAPMCMNLGRLGTCFRKKGVNWAFRIVPEFWIWGPSL